MKKIVDWLLQLLMWVFVTFWAFIIGFFYGWNH